MTEQFFLMYCKFFCQKESLLTYLRTYVPTYLRTYLPTYLTTHPSTHPPTYLPTYPPTHQPTYLPFMMAKWNLVLCLKRERILLHYQMISHLQKKHLLSRSYHLRNCSVILILEIIIMRKKMQCNLQGFLIGGLKDSKELLNKEAPAAITQQMVNILNPTYLPTYLTTYLPT